MKDNDVLQSINTAYDESKCLLDSARLIKANDLDGDLRIPTSFVNSAFGMWVYTEGLSHSKKPWFNPLIEQHQLVYGCYSKLYHAAQKELDATDLFTDFENTVLDFHKKIDVITSDNKSSETTALDKQKQIIKKSPSSKSPKKESRISSSNEDKGLSRTEALLEKLQEQKKVSKNYGTTQKSNVAYLDQAKSDSKDEFADIRDELQKENQNQLALKKELVEQELIQVEERRKLFTKTITQLDFHHQLKEKESKLVIKSCKEKLSNNTLLKKKKISELKSYETKRDVTLQEFEDMELASVEFEKAILEEQAKDEEIANQIAQELKQVEKDHKKVITQQDSKKKALEALKLRVKKAEKELDALIEDELKINKNQEAISNKKLRNHHEVEEKLAKQHKDRENYLHLEELKFQNLQRIKKQCFSTQQEIIQLENERKNIQHQKKESSLFSLNEMKKLQEQRNLKQQMLALLEEEYKEKETELKNIKEKQLQFEADFEREVKAQFGL